MYIILHNKHFKCFWYVLMLMMLEFGRHLNDAEYFFHHCVNYNTVDNLVNPHSAHE